MPLDFTPALYPTELSISHNRKCFFRENIKGRGITPQPFFLKNSFLIMKAITKAQTNTSANIIKNAAPPILRQSTPTTINIASMIASMVNNIIIFYLLLHKGVCFYRDSYNPSIETCFPSFSFYWF